MNVMFSRVLRPLTLSVGLVTVLALAGSPAWAQVLEDPNAGFSNPEENNDPFSSSNRDNAGYSSMFDIIHRSNLSVNQSMSEFEANQQRIINNQATDFRTRQLELIRQQQQAELGESTPINVPSGN